MKRTFNFIVIFLITIISQAQIKNAGSITADNMMRHITYLASDQLKGRKSGYEGQKLATAYIANEFLKAGLLSKSSAYDSAAYLQRFYLFGRENSSVKLEYDSTLFANTENYDLSGIIIGPANKKFNKYNGHAFLYYGMPIFEKNMQKKVIWLNNTDNPSLTGIDPSSALFIKATDLNNGLDKIEKLQNLYNNKMIFLNLPFNEYEVCKNAYITSWLLEMPKGDKKEYYSFGFGKKTGVTINSSMQTIKDFLKKYPEIQLFIVNNQLAEAIFNKKGSKLDKLKDGTSKKIQYSFNFNPDYVSLPTENVLGYIEGTDKKDEVIVIGAHYDHIGVSSKGVNYGADDNASGTAALIEIAKAFAEAKKQGFSSRRSILFIAFTGEEEGLYGSKYYVNHPWFEMDKTVAMLNMDMIGRYNKKSEDTCYYSYAKACGNKKIYLKHQLKKVNKKNEKIKLDFHPGLLQRLGFSFGSDHYNFKKLDVPTILFSSGFIHPDYHSPKDTPDKIKPENSAKIAQLVYLLAWELANKD